MLLYDVGSCYYKENIDEPVVFMTAAPIITQDGKKSKDKCLICLWNYSIYTGQFIQLFAISPPKVYIIIIWNFYLIISIY